MKLFLRIYLCTFVDKQLFAYFNSIREALEKLNDLVDESDPDLDLPNIVHAFQGMFCLFVFL